MVGKYTRRDILRACYHAGLSIPFMPSLLSAAELNLAKGPKRFIVLQTAHGQYADHWYPHKSIPRTSFGTHVRGIRLSDLHDPISLVFGKDFDRFKDKILLLQGFDIISTNDVSAHAPHKSLDASGKRSIRTPTIDQLIAYSDATYGNDLKGFRSIHLKNRGESEVSMKMSYHPKLGDIPTIDNVMAAYQRVFHAFYTNSRVKSFLDTEYATKFSKIKLADADRRKLQEHYEILQEIHINSTRCEDSLKPEGLDNDAKRLTWYMNLISSAVKCDVSRVITFNMTDIIENKILTHVRGGPRFHDMSHEYGSSYYSLEQYLEAQQFYAKFVAMLLAHLDEVEEPSTGRTFLDNSLVLWIGENGTRCSEQMWNTGHLSADLPIFVAGGAGGFLKTGYFLNFQKAGIRKRLIYTPTAEAVPLPYCSVGKPCEYSVDFPDLGRPINELLVTFMTAMGLHPSEWELGGKEGFGDYSDNWFDQYDISDKRRLVAEIIT